MTCKLIATLIGFLWLIIAELYWILVLLKDLLLPSFLVSGTCRWLGQDATPIFSRAGKSGCKYQLEEDWHEFQI